MSGQVRILDEWLKIGADSRSPSFLTKQVGSRIEAPPAGSELIFTETATFFAYEESTSCEMRSIAPRMNRSLYPATNAKRRMTPISDVSNVSNVSNL